MSLKVYHYPACSTCRKALAWLGEHGIAHARVHIVEQPPSTAVLKQVLAQGVPLRALFNTSGASYRSGGFKDKLPSMSEADALLALTADGKLVKRPLVVGDGVALVGFREDEWEKALAR